MTAQNSKIAQHLTHLWRSKALLEQGHLEEYQRIALSLRALATPYVDLAQSSHIGIIEQAEIGGFSYLSSANAQNLTNIKGVETSLHDLPRRPSQSFNYLPISDWWTETVATYNGIALSRGFIVRTAASQFDDYWNTVYPPTDHQIDFNTAQIWQQQSEGFVVEAMRIFATEILYTVQLVDFAFDKAAFSPNWVAWVLEAGQDYQEYK